MGRVKKSVFTEKGEMMKYYSARKNINGQCAKNCIMYNWSSDINETCMREYSYEHDKLQMCKLRRGEMCEFFRGELLIK